MRKLLPVIFLSLCPFISSNDAKSADGLSVAIDTKSAGAILCNRPVTMTCTQSIDAKGVSFADCKATVTFVQSSSATHVYGCDLRVRPQIFDNLTVGVIVLQRTNFVPYLFNFNADIGGGESQVAVHLQRPIDQVSTVKFDGIITVRGRTTK